MAIEIVIITIRRKVTIEISESPIKNIRTKTQMKIYGIYQTVK
jgi:hypothetical protein